ncbi:hypothetical protein, partial [Pseudomonas viridiflava]|uniref:hypothetical protein n=1 Tax=Pseudomonas viridiflava TaxID=33069 RepID=UPI00197DB490
QHFHADHPVFSCSKSEQKQLNTWVSFQSAEEPLLGQFSVSGNRMAEEVKRSHPKEGPGGPFLGEYASSSTLSNSRALPFSLKTWSHTQWTTLVSHPSRWQSDLVSLRWIRM